MVKRNKTKCSELNHCYLVLNYLNKFVVNKGICEKDLEVATAVNKLVIAAEKTCQIIGEIVESELRKHDKIIGQIQYPVIEKKKTDLSKDSVNKEKKNRENQENWNY